MEMTLKELNVTDDEWSSMQHDKHLRIRTMLSKCLLRNWSKLWKIIRCIVNVQHCIVVLSANSHC